MDVHCPQKDENFSKSQEERKSCSNKIFFFLNPKKDEEHVPTKSFFFLSPKKDEEHALAKEKQDKEYKPFTNHTKEINTHIHTHT